MNDLFMQKAATISPCGRYRYRLSRTWDVNLPKAYWVMLNPSVADHEVDDPTIKRVVRFSSDWHMGGAVVLNLFAFRATDPRELKSVADPVGPENDAHLLSLAEARPGVIVAGWGAGGGLFDRDFAVLYLLRKAGIDGLACMGTTGDGFPRHPLYLKADARPTPYAGR